MLLFFLNYIVLHHVCACAHRCDCKEFTIPFTSTFELQFVCALIGSLFSASFFLFFLNFSTVLASLPTMPAMLYSSSLVIFQFFSCFLFLVYSSASLVLFFLSSNSSLPLFSLLLNFSTVPASLSIVPMMLYASSPMIFQFYSHFLFLISSSSFLVLFFVSSNSSQSFFWFPNFSTVPGRCSHGACDVVFIVSSDLLVPILFFFGFFKFFSRFLFVYFFKFFCWFFFCFYKVFSRFLFWFF